ncbi:hypothetical protein DNTS_020995 [Danionella cerebrum]|uniref:Uncharacterized protein n=1 Tax=Danionella cerebrum TaxID=2873325 RepID=A0A553NA94_9TELE|nr:hypothetical protein DNTS_020995 [Danionella translucida]
MHNFWFTLAKFKPWAVGIPPLPAQLQVHLSQPKMFKQTQGDGGRLEDLLHNSRKTKQDDSSVDEEKRRNYGGVYVGIPADLSNVTGGQAPSTHKGSENWVRLGLGPSEDHGHKSRCGVVGGKGGFSIHQSNSSVQGCAVSKQQLLNWTG